jgi:hypothetical protein
MSSCWLVAAQRHNRGEDDATWARGAREEHLQLVHEERVMKGFAVLTMLFVLFTGCVAAEHEAPEVAPVAAEAVLTEERAAEVVLTEEAAALFAPITVNGFCEEVLSECVASCFELPEAPRRSCVRVCQREYEECLGN